METYEFHLARWWHLQLLTRNPLVRMSDRLEGAAILVAVVVSLTAAAFAGALGTAVHDSQARKYAEQALTRHTVGATAIDDSSTTVAGSLVTRSTTARWQVDGTEYTGEVFLDRPVKAGEVVDIWVDTRGGHVGPPTLSRAGTDAVAVAVIVWLAAVLATEGLAAMVRARLRRLHDAAWDEELLCLADDGGGRTNRRP